MLNVLIADDDKICCECLKNLVAWKKLGCKQPVTAFNGMDAWELLQEQRFDFIICDLKMPVMDGLELCRRIFEDGIQTEMVFLSAYEDFAIARTAMQYGVRDYILKPIGMESIRDLEKIIGSVKRRKDRRKQNIRFFDEAYNHQIIDAIHNHDIAFIDGLFEGMKELDRQEIKIACNSLLYTLYEYLCVANRGTQRQVFENIYKKWRSSLMLLDRTESCISYVKELYLAETGTGGTDADENQAFRHICRLVEESFRSQDCNIAWLADKLHMTCAYVGRIFKNQAGVSLTEYIGERRVREACRLLEETRLPMGEISREVGYTDPNYFAKSFRSHMGISPSEYRKKNSHYS